MILGPAIIGLAFAISIDNLPDSGRSKPSPSIRIPSTAAFQFNIQCDDFLYSSCSMAKLSLRFAATRIAEAMYLTRPITVDVQFLSQTDMESKLQNQEESIISAASSIPLYSLVAKTLPTLIPAKMDGNRTLLYPQAAIKQSNPNFNPSKADFSILFNIDTNWKFGASIGPDEFDFKRK